MSKEIDEHVLSESVSAGFEGAIDFFQKGQYPVEFERKLRVAFEAWKAGRGELSTSLLLDLLLLTNSPLRQMSSVALRVLRRAVAVACQVNAPEIGIDEMLKATHGLTEGDTPADSEYRDQIPPVPACSVRVSDDVARVLISVSLTGAKTMASFRDALLAAKWAR